MVEAAADRQHVLVGLEAGPGRSRAREEEPDRFLFDERGHRVLALGRQPQELAAGDEQAQARARGKQLAELRRRLDHLLEVVEHEQHLLRADVAGELLARAERRADRRANARRIAHRLQRHPPNAVLEIVHDLGGGLHGEPRLPRAARAGQRQQARRGCAEEREHLAELLLATDERRRLHRQVRLVERFERRELAVAELVEPLGRRQVLEPVLAEVAQAVGARRAPRRLRDEHLAAVPDRRDPRRAVDVDPDVALVGHERLARVHAHAHADRPVVERLADPHAQPPARHAHARTRRRTRRPGCRPRRRRSRRTPRAARAGARSARRRSRRRARGAASSSPRCR